MDRPGLKQATVALGEPGVGLKDPDSPALDVLTSVLNNFGGRLFNQIRSREVHGFCALSVLLPPLSPINVLRHSWWVTTLWPGALDTELRSVIKAEFSARVKNVPDAGALSGCHLLVCVYYTDLGFKQPQHSWHAHKRTATAAPHRYLTSIPAGSGVMLMLTLSNYTPQGLAYSVSGGWNTTPLDHVGLFTAGGETAAPDKLLRALRTALEVGTEFELLACATCSGCPPNGCHVLRKGGGDGGNGIQH